MFSNWISTPRAPVRVISTFAWQNVFRLGVGFPGLTASFGCGTDQRSWNFSIVWRSASPGNEWVYKLSVRRKDIGNIKSSIFLAAVHASSHVCRTDKHFMRFLRSHIRYRFYRQLSAGKAKAACTLYCEYHQQSCVGTFPNNTLIHWWTWTLSVMDFRDIGSNW